MGGGAESDNALIFSSCKTFRSFNSCDRRGTIAAVRVLFDCSLTGLIAAIGNPESSSTDRLKGFTTATRQRPEIGAQTAGTTAHPALNVDELKGSTAIVTDF